MLNEAGVEYTGTEDSSGSAILEIYFNVHFAVCIDLDSDGIFYAPVSEAVQAA